MTQEKAFACHAIRPVTGGTVQDPSRVPGGVGRLSWCVSGQLLPKVVAHGATCPPPTLPSARGPAEAGTEKEVTRRS